MKVLEILRLYEMEQFTYKQIGEHAGVGKSTVGDVIKRCKEAGINYQKAQAMSVADLTAILYPARTGPKKARAEPDFPRYHAQMQSSRFKNLEYIWTEVYRPEEPDGYSYSHFCYLYGLWCNRTGKKVVMPLEREPGKELFIDWIPCARTVFPVCDAPVISIIIFTPKDGIVSIGLHIPFVLPLSI